MSYLDVATSSATDEWSTPGWLVGQLAAEFAPGGFDLDPCATAENAKAPAYFTRGDDGLAQPWRAACAFVNPPYGRTIGAWTRKAVEEVGGGHAELVVALLPAKVDTAWWRAASTAAALVRFWPGRIHFGNGDRAPFGTAVLVFGTLTWTAWHGSGVVPSVPPGVLAGPGRLGGVLPALPPGAGADQITACSRSMTGWPPRICVRSASARRMFPQVKGLQARPTF